jgi:hypothetical protein
MTAGGEAAWCRRCRHMLVKTPGGYVHASDDDWSGKDCWCVSKLAPCLPQAAPRASL